MNNTGVTKRPARSKSTDTEDTVERHLMRQVKALRGMVLKLPAIWYTGIPDRLVLLPQARVAFVELKRPKGGRYEPLQPWWLKRLAKLGFTVATLHTKEAVDDFLKDLTR